MPRITPVDGKTLDCVFRKAGFVFERGKGDHRPSAQKNPRGEAKGVFVQAAVRLCHQVFQDPGLRPRLSRVL